MNTRTGLAPSSLPVHLMAGKPNCHSEQTWQPFTKPFTTVACATQTRCRSRQIPPFIRAVLVFISLYSDVLDVKISKQK